MYSTVVLGLPAARTELFLRTVRSRPKTFFAERVKRVYLTGSVYPDQATEILSVCTQAQTLVCWAQEVERYRHTVRMGFVLRYQVSALLGLVASFSTLQRISVRAEAIWDMRTAQPDFRLLGSDLFSRLTHLDIVNPSSTLRTGAKLWTDSGISDLPKLECLSIGSLDSVCHAGYAEILRDVLHRCPRLRMVVVLSPDSAYWEEQIDDSRFTAVSKFNHKKRLIEYWEEVRAGGMDFWDLCESIRSQKTNVTCQGRR